MPKPIESETSVEVQIQFPHLAPLESYRGISERIKGFQRIKEAIGDTQAVTTVEPLILMQGLYYDWQKNGSASNVQQYAQHIWNTLDGDNNPLIVRRLFPDKNGTAQDGPRSGNVNSIVTLYEEIIKFFQYL